MEEKSGVTETPTEQVRRERVKAAFLKYFKREQKRHQENEWYQKCIDHIDALVDKGIESRGNLTTEVINSILAS